MQDCPLIPSKKFKAFISKIIQKIVNVIEKLLRKTLFVKIVNENEFNINGLIVPKKWKIDLEVYFFSEIHNFYLIQ